MDGLFKQEHLKKSPISVEKKAVRTSTVKLQEKNVQKTAVSKNKERTASAANDIFPVPLQERDLRALAGAADTALNVNVLSDKKHLKRVNAYNAMKDKYGSGVTMETAVLQREMAKYRSSKSAALPDISSDIFERKNLQNAASHYDIRNIMQTRDALQKISKDPDAFGKLSLKEKTMVKAGLDAFSQLEAASAMLLKTNGLDENGHPDKGLLKDKPAKAEFIDAGEKFRDSFSSSLNKALSSPELKLGKATQSRIEKNASDSAIEDTLRGKHLERVHEILQKKSVNKAYEEGLARLGEEFEKTTAELHEKESVLKAMKDISRQAEPAEKEKLEARIACMEQDMDYYLLKNRNKRVERMIKGACMDRPVTVSMKQEMKDSYNIG